MEPLFAPPTPEPQPEPDKPGFLHGRKLPASIVAGGAAVAMILAGLGIANAQTSDSTPPSSTTAPADGPRGGHHGPGRPGIKADLSGAATAIGISADELRTGLEAGKSIATIAGEHGVEAQKVIDALVADAKAHLAKGVTDGKLTQAQADERSANLESRITELVNRTPPARPAEGDKVGPDRRGMAGPGAGFEAAATAIGISPQDLKAGLEAGKSLATIAGEHNVDAQKVIDAMVADAKAKLAQAVTDGKLTQAEADKVGANVETRITELVNNTPPARPADGFKGAGPGRRGPAGMKGGLDAAAGAIGISVDELRAGLASGKSLATIAGEHNVDAAKVGDAIVADAKSHLDEAVGAGKLTQAQADKLLAGLQSHVGDLLNRTGPAGGPGHRGPGAGAAPDGQPQPAVYTS